MPSYTCISCRVAFTDSDVQRAHYKTDWHRYNLKRKVADMPPVTAESFREKVLAQKAESSAQEQEKKYSQYCDVCNKVFSSANAFANHLQSKKHKELHSMCEKRGDSEGNNQVEKRDKMSVQKPEDDESCEEYEDLDDDSLETTQCLFCPHFSITFEDNMRHMTRSHSFFIPDVQYVTDLEGLVGYLGEKVGLGKICLYCNDKGKTFHSVEAVQKHMVDKGHCKIFYEGDGILEFSDFYDFTSTYPDQDNETGSSDEISLQDSALTVSASTGELCLPSGARVGHRSLKRYYRQNLQPEHVRRNEIVVRGLISDYKVLGWNSNIGEANRLRIQNLEIKNKIQRRCELKLAVKANKFQPHFREQVKY